MERSYLALILFVSSVYAVSALNSNSYESCESRYNRHVPQWELSCYKTGLTEIPLDPPPNPLKYKMVEFLVNKLKKIRKGSLDIFRNVETLYIVKSSIGELPPGIFEKLTKVKFLELSNNRISILTRGAFRGLINLDALLLEINNIAVIEDNAFEGAPNITAIQLRDNQLTYISEQAFHGLKKLSSLDLQNQRSIRKLSLTLGMFSSFIDYMPPNKVQILNLENNNFDCTCKMNWLVHLLNRKVLPSGKSMTVLTDYPPKNVKCRNRNILDKSFADAFMKQCCLRSMETGESLENCNYWH